MSEFRYACRDLLRSAQKILWVMVAGAAVLLMAGFTGVLFGDQAREIAPVFFTFVALFIWFLRRRQFGNR